jgi:putative oxidoreductase
MSRIIPLARILLGLGFVVFAANYFVPFLPSPGMPGPDALAFIIAFKGAGLLTLIKAIELVAGLALLANRLVPLSLALLAPILVGILGFHAAYAPEGLMVPGVLLALELVLAWGYRSAFAPMLKVKVTPEAPAASEHPALAIAR